jgi:hypothetical protein
MQPNAPVFSNARPSHILYYRRDRLTEGSPSSPPPRTGSRARLRYRNPMPRAHAIACARSGTLSFVIKVDTLLRTVFGLSCNF